MKQINGSAELDPNAVSKSGRWDSGIEQRK